MQSSSNKQWQDSKASMLEERESISKDLVTGAIVPLLPKGRMDQAHPTVTLPGSRSQHGSRTLCMNLKILSTPPQGHNDLLYIHMSAGGEVKRGGGA